jgi:GTP-binding protein EngB required for normal cell division
VRRGGGTPFHLIDLPGYGFTRGSDDFDEIARAAFDRAPAALLLVDARHPGLKNDRAAWQWIRGAASRAAIVATKIDKLARGERIRAMSELESVFEEPVLAVSAVTGEGLDDLWKLIDRLLNSSSNPQRRSSNNPQRSSNLRRSSSPREAATAPPAGRRRRQLKS